MTKNSLFASVILPAHNEETYLSASLSSLLNQDYPRHNYEILLVNNQSNDATVEIAKSYGVHVIDEPIGPVGRVRNTGAKAAKSDYLLFLDSDCVAPKHWISYALNKLSRDPALVLGGGYELRNNAKPLERYWLLDGKHGATLPNELLGGSIAVSKSAFFQAGGFDETVTSGEDTKLSKTLRQQGFYVVIDRQMSVVHLGNPTDIRLFFLRQIWHSENYIQDLRNSLKDPTFYLIFLFTILVPVSFITAPFNGNLSLLTALSAAAIPATFSLKRVNRSKNFAHFKNIHKIYQIDFVYVLGRSLGFLKGLYTALKNK